MQTLTDEREALLLSLRVRGRVVRDDDARELAAQAAAQATEAQVRALACLAEFDSVFTALVHGHEHPLVMRLGASTSTRYLVEWKLGLGLSLSISVDVGNTTDTDAQHATLVHTRDSGYPSYMNIVHEMKLVGATRDDAARFISTLVDDSGTSP